MADIQPPEKIQELPLAIIRNMVALSSSGFGVVVALAWNEFVRNAVQTYIDPYLGKNSGIASLFIYAVIMTILAVVVTMQLTLLQRKLELLHEKIAQRKKDKEKGNC
jgi:hypothetical protein